MDKATLKAIGLATVATAICGSLMAQAQKTARKVDVNGSASEAASPVTFGSNLFLEPCSTCDFDLHGGNAVWGPDNCSNPELSISSAVPFVSAATGIPNRILAPILLNKPGKCPTRRVTLSIYTDTCYPTGPGTPLVSGVADCPPRNASCALAIARLKNAPTLTKGTKYWVVATPNDRQSGLDATWYSSNYSQIGVNRGDYWFQFNSGTPAFAVLGRAQSDRDVSKGASAKMPEASRPIFGANLFIEPCGSCNYDVFDAAYPVWGPDNCAGGQTEWLGVPFIAAETGIPSRISAAIILNNPAACPTNKVTLSIYTDDCYPIGPGTPLVSGEATVPSTPCDLTVATLQNAPSLTKGTKYWVVATTNAAQAGLDATWYASNNAQVGVDIGAGWYQRSSATPAFIVQ